MLFHTRCHLSVEPASFAAHEAVRLLLDSNQPPGPGSYLPTGATASACPPSSSIPYRRHWLSRSPPSLPSPTLVPAFRAPHASATSRLLGRPATGCRSGPPWFPQIRSRIGMGHDGADDWWTLGADRWCSGTRWSGICLPIGKLQIGFPLSLSLNVS